MVDFRAFRGLRYTAKAGDLGDLISPPYDVLSDPQVDALLDRSPYNVIRIEHPLAALRDGDRYAAAATLFDDWRSRSILQRDDQPAFYLHEQRFEEDGRQRTRHVLYGRLKLSPWDEGEVLPHEYTMAGPKEDRLRLISALRANVSPLYLLYDDSDADIAPLFEEAINKVSADEASADGENHRLWILREESLVNAIQDAFLKRRLYMADGHHRYETALAYHEQAGDQASRYVLVGLTAASDPGLSIHATHRLYWGDVGRHRARALAERDFVVREVSRERLVTELQGPEVAIGVAGLNSPGSLLVLQPRDLDELSSRVPGGPEQWRRLDVNLVQHVVLGDYLRLDPLKAEQPGLSYVHSVEEALDAVSNETASLAVLLRPVSPSALVEVSEAGARLPQKTTYFNPKLPTGLVLNLLD